MSIDINLFIFPFAGATARLFLPLRKYLLPNVKVIPIDPPGHGARIDQEPLQNLNLVIDDVINQITSYGDTPFILYGHSFGGRIAEQVTRKVQRIKKTNPLHLFLSGCAIPNSFSLMKDIFQLSDDDLLDELKNLGGYFLSKEEFPEYYNQMISVLRADFSAMYNNAPFEDELINPPLTVFWTDGDVIKKSETMKWSSQAKYETQFVELKGNHFFPLKNFERIAREINDKVIKDYHNVG